MRNYWDGSLALSVRCARARRASPVSGTCDACRNVCDWGGTRRAACGRDDPKSAVQGRLIAAQKQPFIHPGEWPTLCSKRRQLATREGGKKTLTQSQLDTLAGALLTVEFVSLYPLTVGLNASCNTRSAMHSILDVVLHHTKRDCCNTRAIQVL